MQMMCISEYSVFGVSPAMIAHTMKQQFNTYIFSLLLHIFTINGEPGSSGLLTNV